MIKRKKPLLHSNFLLDTFFFWYSNIRQHFWITYASTNFWLFQHDCEDMVEKCRVTLKLREESLRKARENALRSESINISPSMSTDPMKRRREMEKKKRIEEEAVIKVSDGNFLWILIGSSIFDGLSGHHVTYIVTGEGQVSQIFCWKF